MTTSSRRRSALIASAIAVGFTIITFAAPTAAAPPEFSSFDEQGEFLIECDGFAIDVAATSHVTVRAFFDAAGDVQRVSVKLTAVDVLTNNVTERQIVNRGVFEEMFTRIGDTEEFSHTLVGFRYMGTAAGEGLILQDVGRVVYSPEHNVVSLAGQHDAEEFGEQEALCAALT
ncbi:hypothetical protein [Agromyces bauzanensis]